MKEEIELIKQIQNGNEHASEILVRQYYKMVYSFLYRKINNKELAMDLTQETFIKMLKNIKKFDQKGNFKNWLLTIASNLSKDYFKSKTFKEETQTTTINEEITKSENNVLYIFEKDEKRNNIKEALESLSSNQKEAIILKYYHDMKIKDIAKVQDTNESTIKTRLKGGLEKIKLFVNRGDETDEKKAFRKSK